jgi:hypothetical protein
MVTKFSKILSGNQWRQVVEWRVNQHFKDNIRIGHQGTDYL